jgi:hypothetical protein
MSINRNFKQRYKSIQGLRSFKNTLPTSIKKIVLRKGENFSKILENWKFIVGKDLFNICYPKSIHKNIQFKKKTLKIMVSRGSEVDVEYSKQKIINKFNTFVGYEAISSIKIEIFEKDTKKINITNKYVTKSKYSKKISEVKNDKIKNSLYELEKLFKLK